MFSGLRVNTSERESSSPSTGTGTTSKTNKAREGMSSSSGNNNASAAAQPPPRPTQTRGHHRHSSLGSLDTITTAINSIEGGGGGDSILGEPPVSKKSGGGGRHRRTSSGGSGSGAPQHPQRGGGGNNNKGQRRSSSRTRGAPQHQQHSHQQHSHSHVRHDSVDTVQTGNTTMDTVVRSLDLADMGQVAEMLAMDGSLNGNGNNNNGGGGGNIGSGGGGSGNGGRRGGGQGGGAPTPHNHPTPTATGNSSRGGKLIGGGDLPETPTPPRGRGGSSESHHGRSNSGGGAMMDGGSLPPSSDDYGGMGSLPPSASAGGGPPHRRSRGSSHRRSNSGGAVMMDCPSLPPSSDDYGGGGSRRRSNSGGAVGMDSASLPPSSDDYGDSIPPSPGRGLSRRSHSGGLASRSFEYTPPRRGGGIEKSPSMSSIGKLPLPPSSPSEAALHDLIVHGVRQSLTPRGGGNGKGKKKTTAKSSSLPSLSSFGTGRDAPSKLSCEDDPAFKSAVVERLRVELDALLPLLVSNRPRDAPAVRGLFSNLEEILRSSATSSSGGGGGSRAEVLHVGGERSVTVEVIEMGNVDGGGGGGGGGYSSGGGSFAFTQGGVLPPLPHGVAALLSRVVLVAAMRLDEHGCESRGGGGTDRAAAASSTTEWAQPALDFWIAASKHLQPDLVLAILRYPLGQRALGEVADGGRPGFDLRTMFSVLADIVLQRRRRDGPTIVGRTRGEWYEDSTGVKAFVALTHALRVAELAETRLCAPLSSAATSSSPGSAASLAAPPSILGSPADVVLGGASSRATLMCLVRCAAAGIVVVEDRSSRPDGPPRGSCAALLASVLRGNLLDPDDFTAALGSSSPASATTTRADDDGGATPMETEEGGSSSPLELPRLTTALVRSIRRFFESSTSSSSGHGGDHDGGVEGCAMSSLSLVALLLDSSLVDINSTTLYGDATMDHLLTASFFSSAKDTTISNGGNQATTLRALDDVCRCNASTGGLTVLKGSSKSMGHSLRRGWRAVLSHALNGGPQQSRAGGEGEAAAAAAANAVACLRVMHDHCPAQVRQALRDVATKQARAATTAAATRDLEDSENSGILGNHRSGANDAGTKTRHGGSSIITTETIWDKLGSALLALTCHENIETSSNAAALLARLLQGPPPSSRVKTTSAHRQDEISRGLWDCLEGDDGDGHEDDHEEDGMMRGQDGTCSSREIVSVVQHIVRLFRMVEACHRGSTSSLSYGTRNGMDLGGGSGDGTVHNSLLVARGNDHDVVIGTLRLEPRLCSALDVAAFILQSERCMDYILQYNHAVVAETSKGGGSLNPNKERDMIDVLCQIACCQVSVADVISNKETQSSLPSKDDLHVAGACSNGLGCVVSLGASFLLSRLGYTNLPCNASSISSDSRDEARYDQQLSARKSLRGCLFHGSSPSSVTTNITTKSYHLKLNGVFRNAAAQPYSRDLTKRAMQLYVELQGTTRENVSFCADALFSSCVRKHQSSSKLFEKVQSKQGEVDKLRQAMSSLTTELDNLKSSNQRKAIAWERELHHAETRAEADATEMLDRCTREKEGAERRAKACQRALSQMKVALEEMERGKNESDAELTRTRALAERAQADAASQAQKAADLQTSLEREREERESKENVLRSTLQEVTNLKDQMADICEVRTEVEQKLASSEKELDTVRCSKGEADARIEDAFAKLIGLADAYKQKEDKVKALQAEVEEATRSSNSKLNAAIKRCALAEGRESDLKSENELLREKLLQMKQRVKDASGQGHRAAAAYRSSRM